MPVLDQGADLERYMLIPRVLIFITRGDQVLLLKGSPTKRLWSGRYNGVGGHVERGEDVLAAARRELSEETGLSYPVEISTPDLWLCGTLVVDTGKIPGIGVYIFTGEKPDGNIQPSAEGSLEWIDLKVVPTIPCVEDLPILLERIRTMKPGDPPFSARSYYRGEQLIVEFSE